MPETRASTNLEKMVLQLKRSAPQRGALAALGMALCFLMADMMTATPQRAEMFHWIYLGAIGMCGLVALVFLTKRSAVDKQPAIRELLDQRGSVIRIVTRDRIVRVLLRSGDELSLFATAAEQLRLLELLREHSPSADLAADT